MECRGAGAVAEVVEWRAEVKVLFAEVVEWIVEVKV